MALILPSLYSELEGPALANIVGELTRVPYLSEIVIGLDRHSEEHAVELFASNIMEAGKAFLEYPCDKPFIPSWNRVQAEFPNVGAYARSG